MTGAVLTVLVLCALLISAALAQEGDKQTTTVLFTHDLHSHFLPQTTQEGEQSGGYARLATALALERAKYPDALTLDGGDFSIGSLIQTLYTTKAPELVTMGALGYDATTPGNHEFDHGPQGFAQMLQAARGSGAPLPALLVSNYMPDRQGPYAEELLRAMSRYGTAETTLIQRGGVTYGIFGVMGQDSSDCAPASGFLLEDPVKAAQRCVDALKAQGAQFIIALSHGGTEEKVSRSEDQQLAKAVQGIDLIVSGHTHTTLDRPIVEGDTYIVSAGPYCEALGSITLEWGADGKKVLKDYRLVPIDQTIPEDAEIAALVEQWKGQVGGAYLSRYDMTYDQVLARAPFDLDTPTRVQEGNALGELVADAFRWAVRQAEGEDYVPIAAAITADGVLRAPLRAGDITVSQAFDVLSMGVGTDGTSGFPLVSVYLTGRELKAALEVDASVTPLMSGAQLYLSGIDYRFNTYRMLFDRLTDCQLRLEDGTTQQIQDDQLYRVVSGMYSAQMLSTVKGKSMGLLSMEPKDAQGAPITDFTQHIIYDRAGSEVKEWYALASYLSSFPQEDGVPQIPEQYAAPDGRKDVYHSVNPYHLLRSSHWMTWVAALILVVVTALSIWGVRTVLHRMRVRRYKGRSRGRSRR